MSAAYTGISIERGAEFSMILDIDRGGGEYSLANSSFEGQIRRNFDNALQAQFLYEILNEESGKARIYLTSNQTKDIDLAPCYWDLFCNRSGDSPDKLLYGPVEVIKSATLL